MSQASEPVSESGVREAILNLEHSVVSFGDVDIPQAYGDGWRDALTAAAALAGEREAELARLQGVCERLEAMTRKFASYSILGVSPALLDSQIEAAKALVPEPKTGEA